MRAIATGSPLTDEVVAVVQQVIADIRPRLVTAALSGDRAERTNRRHADNFLSEYDMWLHERYRTLLAQRLPTFVYASEEGEPEVVPGVSGSVGEPDLCVFVDPLDTSELAVRGLHGYTHVLVYSRALGRPVAAVVGDLFHHIQLYLATRTDDGTDAAYVAFCDSTLHRIKVPTNRRLPDALVTNYLMRPSERFDPLAGRRAFLDALAEPGPDGRQRGRIGVDFGSVGLCHVAVGATDAMVEFAKGFAFWDLYPGHYILTAAGGVVLDLSGAPLSLDRPVDSIAAVARLMDGRQRFVAAGNAELATEIVKLLNTADGS